MVATVVIDVLPVFMCDARAATFLIFEQDAGTLRYHCLLLEIYIHRYGYYLHVQDIIIYLFEKGGRTISNNYNVIYIIKQK